MYFTFVKNKSKFSEITALYAHAPGGPETNNQLLKQMESEIKM